MKGCLSYLCDTLGPMAPRSTGASHYTCTTDAMHYDDVVKDKATEMVLLDFAILLVRCCETDLFITQYSFAIDTEVDIKK